MRLPAALPAVLAGLIVSTAAAQDAPQRPFAIIDGEVVDVPDVPMGDPATIERILDEGVNNNQVMSHLNYLCNEIGPRLTGSTNLEQANRWIVYNYKTWGLHNPHLEEWGQLPVRFDRGPSEAHVVAQQRGSDEFTSVREMAFTTSAWMVGTDGPVTGHVVRMPSTEDEFAAVEDQLEGAWILIPNENRRGQRGIRGGGPRARYMQRIEARRRLAGEIEDEAAESDEGDGAGGARILDRVLAANPAGFMASSGDERVWTSSVRNWRELDPDNIPQDIEVTISGPDYDYINSRLFDGEEVHVRIDANNILTEGPFPIYNTIAEIKGTEKPEEVVIVSAHLDSWNGVGSQGTVDNGTGTAVTMEAARILMAAGARPKRTIRFCHWTGEEQGLLGSREYVQMHREEILNNVSAVFVDDGGTNYEGGLQCIAPMADYLAAATAPINGVFYSETDGEFLNVNVQIRDRMPRGGGSDHASFNRVGVPGFFWDEVGRANYRYGWHTQYDRLDQAIPEYLRQSATCAAVTAYNLACAPELLPRADDDEADSRGQD
jgi:hypothetical protein